jgi:hypothetical protein
VPAAAAPAAGSTPKNRETGTSLPSDSLQKPQPRGFRGCAAALQARRQRRATGQRASPVAASSRPAPRSAGPSRAARPGPNLVRRSRILAKRQHVKLGPNRARRVSAGLLFVQQKSKKAPIFGHFRRFQQAEKTAGLQDHTTSPSASATFVFVTSASTASHRNVRDDRDPPLSWVRRAELCP